MSGNQQAAKYLNRNQLIRIREIFLPFFKVLNDTCISYSIYRCCIQGEESSNGESMIILDFVVSDERGVEKTDKLIYKIEEDNLYYGSNFRFEKNSDILVLNCIKRLIRDLDSVTIPINKIVVENGTRWTLGVLGQDINRRTGEIYQGYVMFLKSDMLFEGYALKTNDEDLYID